MQSSYRKINGFTLLALLLILTALGVMAVIAIGYNAQKIDNQKRDKATLQVQHILNAALSFYVKNGNWPDCPGNIASPTVPVVKNIASATMPGVNVLQTQGFLPAQVNDPWGSSQYSYWCFAPSQAVTNTGATFFVAGTAPSSDISKQIASMLPNGYDAPGGVYVGSINIPGENVGNARSLSFAGVYYSGSCVPAPTCPLGWTPSIFLLPGGVTGSSSQPTGCGAVPPYDTTNCSAEVYPINAYQAFAKGDATGNPVNPNANSGGPPLDCKITALPTPLACQSDPTGNTLLDGTKYWRVCLYVRTENGIAYPNTASDMPWGKMIGSIIAFTRCVPSTEPSGAINVFQENTGTTP